MRYLRYRYCRCGAQPWGECRACLNRTLVDSVLIALLSLLVGAIVFLLWVVWL
jgi:hypothetical protein